MDQETWVKANELISQINDLELGIKQWKGFSGICKLSFVKDSFHLLNIPLSEKVFDEMKKSTLIELRDKVKVLEQQLEEL